MADEIENHSTPARKDHQIRPESLPEKFNSMNLLDPRSPTTAFQRTPIQVILRKSEPTSAEKSLNEKTSKTVSKHSASFLSLPSPQIVEDESLELSASSASFFSLENLTDIDCVNLSIVNSEFSSPSKDGIEEYTYVMDYDVNRSKESNFSSITAATEENPLSSTLLRLVNDEVDRSMEERSIEPEWIEKEEIDITSHHSNITPSKSSEERLTTTNDTNEDSSSDKLFESAILIRKKPLKNLFYTPNPNRKRNPLGPVDNTCPTTPPSHLYRSPQNVMGEKQWKRIQVERKKLGLEADENTQLPLYDITASAPSKLIGKSRLRARRDGVMS